MSRHFVLSVCVAVVACGGGSSAAPAPSDPAAALGEFLDAVQRGDVATLGRLWGTARGPAAGRMDETELDQRLQIIQIYLAHESYRVLGPAPLTPSDEARRAYLVEITRANGCKVAFPIELVQTTAGGWLVNNVNLDEIGNPARPCQ